LLSVFVPGVVRDGACSASEEPRDDRQSGAEVSGDLAHRHAAVGMGGLGLACASRVGASEGCSDAAVLLASGAQLGLVVDRHRRKAYTGVDKLGKG